MHCIEHTQVKTIKGKQYKIINFTMQNSSIIYMTCAVEKKLISDMIKRNLTTTAFKMLVYNVWMRYVLFIILGINNLTWFVWPL